jgi:hypothetical protein
MYRKSNSPYAACIVVAPKETQPFMGICGDYTWINNYALHCHTPIPHIPQELEKISKFKVFADIDMANSFHQFKLDDKTSALLSVVTPLGQFEPMFLPKGVKPASQILQRVVREMLADYLNWISYI